MGIPKQLKSLYRAGRVLPFVGAGVSMSVEWNASGRRRRGLSWKELVDEAARQLGFADPDLARVRGRDLQILEYFRLMHGGDATPLTNWLVRELAPPDQALRDSPIMQELTALDQCSIFYTTNFDNFLERAMGACGRSCHVVANEAEMSSPGSGCQIVKFHGDLNHPKMMVLSESDYERRLAFKSEMDLRLRSDVLGKALLFVGYSFRDPNVAYLFRLVNEQFGRLPSSIGGRRAYILIPDPSHFEIALFDDRNIEVIPIEGVSGNITANTAGVLREIRS